MCEVNVGDSKLGKFWWWNVFIIFVNGIFGIVGDGGGR